MSKDEKKAFKDNLGNLLDKMRNDSREHVIDVISKNNAWKQAEKLCNNKKLNELNDTALETQHAFAINSDDGGHGFPKLMERLAKKYNKEVDDIFFDIHFGGDDFSKYKLEDQKLMLDYRNNFEKVSLKNEKTASSIKDKFDDLFAKEANKLGIAYSENIELGIVLRDLFGFNDRHEIISVCKENKNPNTVLKDAIQQNTIGNNKAKQADDKGGPKGR